MRFCKTNSERCDSLSRALNWNTIVGRYDLITHRSNPCTSDEFLHAAKELRSYGQNKPSIASRYINAVLQLVTDMQPQAIVEDGELAANRLFSLCRKAAESGNVCDDVLGSTILEHIHKHVHKPKYLQACASFLELWSVYYPIAANRYFDNLKAHCYEFVSEFELEDLSERIYDAGGRFDT